MKGGRRHFLAATSAWSLGAGCTRSKSKARQPLRTSDAIFGALILARAEEVDGVLTRALREGATADAIFRATLLAPLLTRQSVRDIHSMAAIVGARRLHQEATSASERLAPLFFAANANHAWSRRKRFRERSPGRSKDLEKAFKKNDVIGADRAMAARIRDEGFDGAARWARLTGTEPRYDLHGVIWTALSAELFKLAGAHRGRLLRSFTRYLSNSPTMAMPEEPLRLDAADSTAPEEITKILRTAPDTDLNGLSGDALFEALACRGTELVVATPFATGRALHYNTALDAFWRLYRLAPVAQRATIVSRAVQRLRPWAVGRNRDLLALSEGPGDPFALAPTKTLAAYRAALRVCAKDSRSFVARVRAEVALHGAGEHDYKFFDALLAVAKRLRSEHLRVRWLAGAVTMEVMRSAEPWPHHPAVLAASRMTR